VVRLGAVKIGDALALIRTAASLEQMTEPKARNWWSAPSRSGRTSSAAARLLKVEKAINSSTAALFVMVGANIADLQVASNCH
jgi:hypothetical protein